VFLASSFKSPGSSCNGTSVVVGVVAGVVMGMVVGAGVVMMTVIRGGFVSEVSSVPVPQDEITDNARTANAVSRFIV
jgi:hypothetical protein